MEFGKREWHEAGRESEPLDPTVTPRRRAGEGWSDSAAVWDDGGFSSQHATERRASDCASNGRDRRSVYSQWVRRRERLRDGGWPARREVLRRLRQPIIGLSLAGAAAPLASAIRQNEAKAAGENARAQHAKSLQKSIGAEAELEDAVASRWRAAQREADGSSARGEAIEEAVSRYGIDADLAADIIDAAEKNGIEADMALGLVKTESTFNPRAVSHVGARGLTQVMPRTARWLRPGTSAEDLFERKLNLDLGFSYLKDLIDKYKGNERLALLAYNRGPGTVDKILKRGGNPDNGYADKVLRG